MTRAVQDPSRRAGSIARRFLTLPSRFVAARSGVAGVEFALIAPLLVFLFIGCVEISHFANNVRKVGYLARAVGEVVSQAETIDAREAQEVFQAAALIMPPFDGSTARIRLSTIGTAVEDGPIQAKVCSAVATANTQARQVGEDLTVLFPVEEKGSRFLYVEVEMPYKILFLGQILDRETGGDTFQVRNALKWPVRKGVRKKSRYPEVVLPIGGPC
ncbi:MAG: pilus assembly protein [Methylobacterium sp.]|uniref:TadE/TadG family type IV pilus assembly protein n=1 Tax=Methylobacterium sp. TaxID=409 RepID=UPI0025D5AB7E|nr:TadE/TadG family type IV pilus assembly protein [Methylobacterium sp.]MBX9930825.1 pilus assembly protein [Methylobacterium sp.]